MAPIGLPLRHLPPGESYPRRRAPILWLRTRNLLLSLLVVTSVVLTTATVASLRPVPAVLGVLEPMGVRAQLLARAGQRLSMTYQHDWNVHDRVALHEIPVLLQTSMLYAEDQRFFEHTGIDWQARAHALTQNIIAQRAVRGASTITEQSVRLMYPRPRKLWSRWLEGFEAQRLERRFSKPAILEFYLNQVPYAANRRGVAQAARYYFDRRVDTLSLSEMLALAVMVRAPSRFDLWRHPGRVRSRIEILARRLHAAAVISQHQFEHVLTSSLVLERSQLDVQAAHFSRYVRATQNDQASATLTTTLDAGLQSNAQAVLDHGLVGLRAKQVNNGAVLVVDHRDNTILAWSVAKPFADTPSAEVNTVTVPRQPGSTLKPFVYAMALESGWTAATSIEDAPLAESVGTGLHRYNNYSRQHYGPVSLRRALANSLNIPAVKALQQVGAGAFLHRLRAMGVHNLTAHPDQYGDGLALGNGEISLLELVQAYTVLARGGVFTPLASVADTQRSSHRVFSSPVASLVGDILSDDHARGLEFGVGGVLNLPVQTAVKTGTSTDHRDTWAVGFNHRYTVGVWMGNLDRSPTLGLTGAAGPAFVLRGIFAALNQMTTPRPLFLNPSLVRKEYCSNNHGPGCRAVSDWFVPGTGPNTQTTTPLSVEAFIRHPSDGLLLAMDPRIDDANEQFRFALSDSAAVYDRIEWVVDGAVVGTTSVPTYLWPLSAGRHTVEARIGWVADKNLFVTRPVSFQVK